MYCASFLQVVLWFIMPAIRSSNYNIKNTTFGLVIVVQYIIRMYLIVPLSNQIIKAAGVVAKTAWGGAAYNLLLYMLASHVCHSIQYILLQNHLFTHSSLQSPNFHICSSEIWFPTCKPLYLQNQLLIRALLEEAALSKCLYETRIFIGYISTKCNLRDSKIEIQTIKLNMIKNI